eukprot:644918-Prorocentrum_lima.AAC.1
MAVYAWKIYDPDTTTPKELGLWWVGPTWFKIKKVNAEFQSLALDGLFDNNIQRALMHDPWRAIWN